MRRTGQSTQLRTGQTSVQPNTEPEGTLQTSSNNERGTSAAVCICCALTSALATDTLLRSKGFQQSRHSRTESPAFTRVRMLSCEPLRAAATKDRTEELSSLGRGGGLTQRNKGQPHSSGWCFKAPSTDFWPCEPVRDNITWESSS